MPITDADALLRQGWEALRAADWQTARSCFEQALGEAESAEALDGLSQATHFLREYDRAIELKERAFAAYRQAGEPVKAADTARWLAFLHGTYHGNYAVASGWMERAEQPAPGRRRVRAHGWLVLDRAPFSATRPTVRSAPSQRWRSRAGSATWISSSTRSRCSASATSRRAGGRGHAAARRGDGRASGWGGRATSRSARSAAGCSAPARPRLTCGAPSSGWRWSERYVAWTDFVRPTCRSHYGGILDRAGALGGGRDGAGDAIQTFKRGYRGDSSSRSCGSPTCACGRAVRGGRAPDGGRRSGTRPPGGPRPRSRWRAATSRSPRSSPGCASRARTRRTRAARRALELLIEIQLAARRADAAASGRSARLKALAARRGRRSGDRLRQLARGRVAAAEDDDGRRRASEAAFEAMSALDLPLEAGAGAAGAGPRDAPVDPDAAARGGALALRAFERLGAARDADAATALLRELGDGRTGAARPNGPLTQRETEVLRLLAAGFPTRRSPRGS